MTPRSSARFSGAGAAGSLFRRSPSCWRSPASLSAIRLNGSATLWLSRLPSASQAQHQDVTIDGWRITAVPVHKQSVMTAISEMGYRVGTLAAGAGALLIADRYGWRWAYLCMAALMTVGAISAFFAPEPQSDFTQKHEHPGFVAAVVAPIKEMVTRLGPLALPIFLMIAGFRMPGYISSAMAFPLFKSLNYSDTDIATVTKLFDSGSRSRPPFSAPTSFAGSA